jgi:hypothetical protein
LRLFDARTQSPALQPVSPTSFADRIGVPSSDEPTFAVIDQQTFGVQHATASVSKMGGYVSGTSAGKFAPWAADREHCRFFILTHFCSLIFSHMYR